jgi:hypothetical protein
MINIESKPTFGFKIVFQLPEGENFHHEGEIPDLILPPNGDRVKLGMIKRPDSKELDRLILKAGGFPSKNDASDYASKIKNAIYITGLLSKKAFKIIKLSIRAEATVYVGASAKVSFSKPLDNFLGEFSKSFELSDKLDDKQSLALELYNMSFFESSQRSGYISLFSAVEVFVKSAKRQLSDSREQCLRKIEEKITRSELCKQDKDFFKGYLGNLRKESNREACKKLIEKNLGVDRAEVFETHQDIRNPLLHEGKIPDNFNNKISELRDIVLNLIRKILNISA